MSELKPCPFCGAQPNGSHMVTSGGFSFTAYHCPGCKAQGPLVEIDYAAGDERTTGPAAAAWNRRTLSPADTTAPAEPVAWLAVERDTGHTHLFGRIDDNRVEYCDVQDREQVDDLMRRRGAYAVHPLVPANERCPAVDGSGRQCVRDDDGHLAHTPHRDTPPAEPHVVGSGVQEEVDHLPGLLEKYEAIYRNNGWDAETRCEVRLTLSTLRSILAALRTAETREPEWQPIETMPKEDDGVLTDGTRRTYGGWVSDTDMGAEYEGQFNSGGWWTVDCWPDFTPTHWRPLPPAPRTPEASDG